MCRDRAASSSHGLGSRRRSPGQSIGPRRRYSGQLYYMVTTLNAIAVGRKRNARFGTDGVRATCAWRDRVCGAADDSASIVTIVVRNVSCASTRRHATDEPAAASGEFRLAASAETAGGPRVSPHGRLNQLQATDAVRKRRAGVACSARLAPPTRAAVAGRVDTRATTPTILRSLGVKDESPVSGRGGTRQKSTGLRYPLSPPPPILLSAFGFPVTGYRFPNVYNVLICYNFYRVCCRLLWFFFTATDEKIHCRPRERKRKEKKTPDSIRA